VAISIVSFGIVIACAPPGDLESTLWFQKRFSMSSTFLRNFSFASLAKPALASPRIIHASELAIVVRLSQMLNRQAHLYKI